MSIPSIVVYYHSPCHDGFLAQLIIQRALSKFTKVSTIPLSHGSKRTWDVGVIVEQSLVLFVDIAPHQEMLSELTASDNVTEIQVWDHHIDYRTSYGDLVWTNCEMPHHFHARFELAGANSKTTLVFSNDISGSRLAPVAAGFWLTRNIELLVSNGFDRGEVQAAIDHVSVNVYEHPIVQHASDYDTWQKKLPHTDAVFAYYRNYKYDDVDRWHKLLDRITDFDSPGYRDIVMKGEAMLEAMTSLAEKLCNSDTPKPMSLTIDGVTYNGVVTNAYSLLANDVGQIMRERGYDFAIMFNVEPNVIALSIRSKPGVPSNKIAQLWGGGGHAGSAGAGITGDARAEWLNQYVFNV